MIEYKSRHKCSSKEFSARKIYVTTFRYHNIIIKKHSCWKNENTSYNFNNCVRNVYYFSLVHRWFIRDENLQMYNKRTKSFENILTILHTLEIMHLAIARYIDDSIGIFTRKDDKCRKKKKSAWLYHEIAVGDISNASSVAVAAIRRCI